MDPITQGVVGASLPSAISQKRTLGAAGLFGALAGMAPDLDSFIRSDTDPLMYLEFHRQFTHSLFFIPFGSLVCALLFYYLFSKRWKISFKLTYIFCFLGYATHGLLDACTSYGTQLLWPFSNERFAFNTISIVDPLFTLPLLALIIIGLKKNNTAFAKAALCWVLAYQGLGFYQHQRVAAAGEQLAEERGHNPIRLDVKPSFANLLLWKVIYEVEDGYYTDAVRAAPGSNGLTIYPGAFIPRLDVERDLPWLDKDSQQANDLERFYWFSRGYLSLDPNNPLRVIDMRYSLVPNEATGMWSIWLSPQANKTDHVTIKQDRDTSSSRREKFGRMLQNN
ncbi:MAG: metal-dependent hydrolase [Gammaproteobacteria bacterium]|nr:metal-dependent hydrolase [Gammaproteobacteria bacterium]MCP4090806.1 metal-dependent hydrolase [Gammaproteobacteria bacterium]MCP4277233.1 metal-dependent hydrolase [Gammaproteobacteria bacterium]MCP4832855.1 metal-dependent hydrolase [Gammaproteobacteria bacterium]